MAKPEKVTAKSGKSLTLQFDIGAATVVSELIDKSGETVFRSRPWQHRRGVPRIDTARHEAVSALATL